MSTYKLPLEPYPSRVLMDLSSDCNLKCPMCVVHGSTDDPKVNAIIKKHMKVADAKQILDEIEGHTKTIGPGLWSEPLMGRDILMHLRSMKRRGFTISMNSNGLLMNKKMALSLVEFDVDSITVSVDATTNDTLSKIRGVEKLEKIEAHVKQLLELRGNNKSPRIGVSFTKQPENVHEVQNFIDKWVEITDFVRIGEIFEDGKFPHIDINHEHRKPCAELYETMSIHTNGDVSICCLDGFKDVVVGNVVETSVKEVWQGKALTKIRKHHENSEWDKVPFCKNCDRWASNIFEEKQEGNMLIRTSAEFTFYNRLDRLNSWKKCR
ncbi:radical SAM/SPASM domain-containing protein [Pseudoalteromonas atlantica]|uniref:radical SAM/SPASM domain-containing protein n=1 Tax=Pseudoalteromonas atlantica TaxID=288 RepID=UPI003735123F